MLLCFLMAVIINSGIVAFCEEDDKSFYLIQCAALPLLTFIGISLLSGYIPELAIAGLLVSIATIFCSFFFSWLSFNAESYYDSYPASFSMIQTLINAGADLNMRFHSCYLKRRGKEIQIKLPLFEYFQYFLFLKNKIKRDKKTKQLKSETAAGTIIKDIISDYVNEQKQEAESYMNQAKIELENIKNGKGLKSATSFFDTLDTQQFDFYMMEKEFVNGRQISKKKYKVSDASEAKWKIKELIYLKQNYLHSHNYEIASMTIEDWMASIDAYSNKAAFVNYEYQLTLTREIKE